MRARPARWACYPVAKRMADQPARQDNLDSFAGEYSRTRSRAARQVERVALGQEVGLNGYTTLDQAQALRDLLPLTPTSVLLDVGAGRGWPGSQVARSHGCRLISTDVPWNALREARAEGLAGGGTPRRDVVAADGRALPFRSTSFDAIVHADVFC